jgi:hypothetical protein
MGARIRKDVLCGRSSFGFPSADRVAAREFQSPISLLEKGGNGIVCGVSQKVVCVSLSHIVNELAQPCLVLKRE